MGVTAFAWNDMVRARTDVLVQAGSGGGLAFRHGRSCREASLDEAQLLLAALARAARGVRFGDLCVELSDSVVDGDAMEIAKWPCLRVVLTSSREAEPVVRWADSSEKERLWNDLYRAGHHEKTWDMAYASQELVGLTLALGLPPSSRALDLGCGAGSDVRFLAERGYEVTGIDISDIGLAIARDRLKRAGRSANLIKCDVLDLPMPDEHFDLVTDRGCFHHVVNRDRRKYAEQVGRVLRPGGWFLLRGCRRSGQMWVPLEEQEIGDLFGDSFERMGFLPFTYDASVAIDAAITLMRRKA
jgi:ubiquinone/menaquinone biosynthesis C-methylase UbiE